MVKGMEEQAQPEVKNNADIYRDSVLRFFILTLLINLSFSYFQSYCFHYKYLKVCISTATNGNWSTWSNWTPTCSATCGTGVYKRWRYCDSPTPSLDGLECVGVDYETKPCTKRSCSGLALANNGESCSAFCQSKGATCNTTISTGNRVEAFTAFGIECSNLISKPLWKYYYHPTYITSFKKCDGFVNVPNVTSCDTRSPPDGRRLCNCQHPDDVRLSEWTTWSECTQTCGNGTQSRGRTCKTSSCNDIVSEIKACNEFQCPVNGGSSEWSSWSYCSSPCETGVRYRERTCTNPTPRFGGKACINSLTEQQSCNVRCCSRAGSWSQWTTWSSCPICSTDGKTQQKRYRTCTNPSPYDGLECEGLSYSYRICDGNLPFNFQCPKTYLNFQAVLPEAKWYNQLLYSGNDNPYFNDLQKWIQYNVKVEYEESESSTINSSVIQVTGNSFRLLNQQVWADVNILFDNLAEEQYLYFIETLHFHNQLAKLSVKTSTQNITIIPSFIKDLYSGVNHFGTVPHEAPIITLTNTISPTEIQVSWLPINQSNFKIEIANSLYGGYHIYYRVANSLEIYKRTSVPHNITLAVIEGLDAATNYMIRILAYNAWGNGIPSDYVTEKTFSQLPDVSRPLPEIQIAEFTPGQVLIEWQEIPFKYMHGEPLTYNFYLKRDETGEVITKKVPYYNQRILFVTISPSSFYVIKMCTENEIGESIDCVKIGHQTKTDKPQWNDFKLRFLPRPKPNSIHIAWNTIPSSAYLGDLLGYNVILTLNHYGYNNSVNSKTTISVQPTKNELVINDLVYSGNYKIQIQALNSYGMGAKSEEIFTDTCKCPLVLTTNYYMKKPYTFRDEFGYQTGLMYDRLKDIVNTSCHMCEVNGKSYYSIIDWAYDGDKKWAEKSSFESTRDKIISSTAVLSFPFVFNNDVTSYMEGDFIAVINQPEMLMLFMTPDPLDFVNGQVQQITALVPYVIPMTLLMVVAGILLWFCEGGRNNQFDVGFFRGICDGVYWSYVTMTTVGYGDKHATTLLGRLFAILWVITSMIVISIYVGSISGVILNSENAKFDVDLETAKIGALSNSYELDFTAAQYKNVLAFKTLQSLSESLYNRKIDVVFINTYDAATNMKLFSRLHMVTIDVLKIDKSYGFVLSKTLNTSKEYFNSAVKTLQPAILRTYKKYSGELTINKPENEKLITLLSIEAPQLTIAMVSLVVMLLLFSTVGWIVWHFGLRRWKHKNVGVDTRLRQKINRDALRECNALINSWSEKMKTKINKLDAKHSKEIVDMWKNMKPGVFNEVRPRNYNIKTISMNRMYVTS